MGKVGVEDRINRKWILPLVVAFVAVIVACMGPQKRVFYANSGDPLIDSGHLGCVAIYNNTDEDIKVTLHPDGRTVARIHPGQHVTEEVRHRFRRNYLKAEPTAGSGATRVSPMFSFLEAVAWRWRLEYVARSQRDTLAELDLWPIPHGECFEKRANIDSIGGQVENHRRGGRRSSQGSGIRAKGRPYGP